MVARPGAITLLCDNFIALQGQASIKQPCTGLCQPLHLQTPGAQAWNLVREQSLRAGHDSWNPDGATKIVTPQGLEVRSAICSREENGKSQSTHFIH